MRYKRGNFTPVFFYCIIDQYIVFNPYHASKGLTENKDKSMVKSFYRSEKADWTVKKSIIMNIFALFCIVVLKQNVL